MFYTKHNCISYYFIIFSSLSQIIFKKNTKCIIYCEKLVNPCNFFGNRRFLRLHGVNSKSIQPRLFQIFFFHEQFGFLTAQNYAPAIGRINLILPMCCVNIQIPAVKGRHRKRPELFDDAQIIILFVRSSYSIL